jgi:hypothetical protein
MAVVAKAATDTLYAASPRPIAEEFNDVFEAQCGRMDVARSSGQQGEGGLIWDKGEPEFLRSLHQQILRVFALEAAAEDSAKSADAATLSSTVLLPECREGGGGGGERRKSVKWLPESELTHVQFFEPVESITDEELALLEKVKDLPHSIQEFLLTETDLVVQGSEELRLALVPRQANRTMRLQNQFRLSVQNA